MASVGDYFNFQNGYAFKSGNFTESGQYKIVRIKELKNGSIKFFADTAQINPDSNFDVDKYIIRKGDVLFALTGDPVNKSNPLSWVGRVSYYNHNEPSLLNQRVCKVVPKANVSSEFLYYFFRQNDEFYNLASKATGSANQANISTKTIEQHNIDIPDKITMDKIVSILSEIDKKIEINKAINRNLEEQIVTNYRAWFLSFEHFADTLEEGELGWQPIGWKVVHLKEVTENIRDRVKGEVDRVKVLSAINTGKLILSEEYFTKQVFSKDISKYILVEKNDFAYNPARVNIGSIGINDLGIRGCVSPVYVVVRTEEGYENFLRYFLHTDRFKTEVISRASGSVRQSMNYTDFGLMKIVYPPKDVVKAFNEMIYPLQIAIKNNEIQNANLAELRDSLLPKLMSGEMDVSDLDI